MILPSDVSAMVSIACLLEAGAPKPGNVSPGRPFKDMKYEDFAASALAIAPVLGQAGQRPLGETIREAIRATRRWTPANTNLGIVLLLAPLARALLMGNGSPLRVSLEQVLSATSVTDAIDAYTGIREASAGGLGSVQGQDLSDQPTIPLLDTMKLAADRDSVASEYATSYAITFETALPALRDARGLGLPWREAVVETYLTVLAAYPDTLIARKCGREVAEEISYRAAAIHKLGGVRNDAGRSALEQFDVELRDPHNRRNPGTTADLTCSAIFVALAVDGWKPD
ncbi:MAG TPA: triphosphoribosyl-dephospho-CoA synthase, partial [Gemmatimonadales bacterium]|nr:triphosphoribosyl-dephospho-CoA synthase [Gemmatimonadales bacterium]